MTCVKGIFEESIDWWFIPERYSLFPKISEAFVQVFLDSIPYLKLLLWRIAALHSTVSPDPRSKFCNIVGTKEFVERFYWNTETREINYLKFLWVYNPHSCGNGKYCACSTSAMYWLNIYIFNIWRNIFLSLRIWSHSPQMQVGS